MQNSQTTQVFNFDKFPNFEKDIDLKQRAWIEVKGIAIETNVRQLRSKLSKIVNLWLSLKLMDMDMMLN